ncbi:MAG TPA: hypothetical protein DCE41_34800, partial [Cytophagales bacterium]|nr:hypothetical protein [Cytophagales bacterium]
GRQQIEVQRMQREEGKLVADLPVSEKASSIRIAFVSDGDWDYDNTQTLQVVDAEGKLYRNGYLESVYSDEGAYTKELAAYPDNYAIYKGRWQILAASQPEEGPEIISEEWALIEEGGTRNAEYYHAKVTSHATLGEFEKAGEGMAELLDKFPASPWITDAYSYLGYMLFSKQASMNPKLNEQVRDYLRAHPGSDLAKERIGGYVFGTVQDEYKDLIASIAEAWLEKEPDLPLMHLAAARVGEDRAERLDHLSQASNLFINQDQMVYDGNTWGYLVYHMLPVAQTYLELGAPSEALGILAVLECNTDKLESDFFETKGAAWEALFQYDKAMGDYLKAADLGSETSLELAKKLYTTHYDPTGESFEAYQAKTLAAQMKANEVPMAADFSVTDLEGNAVALSALRGKVVVLNFWFIGCAPCRVEMPGLNELVADYAEEEVAFVAFALDGQESLEKFLAKKAFDYTIIPDADGIATEYGVQAYPTHVVIDKEGRIQSTLTGGSETRHEDLKPLIDRLLR